MMRLAFAANRRRRVTWHGKAGVFVAAPFASVTPVLGPMGGRPSGRAYRELRDISSARAWALSARFEARR
jgi:hypothetical protein